MRAPNFWHQKNYISYATLPLSYLYQLAAFLRKFFTKSIRIDKPVICIGNVVSGGAGKTSIAIELGLMLQEIGIKFAYLSHGYGAKFKNFTLVNKDSHSSDQVGDESLLLAKISNCFIGKNKAFSISQINKMPHEKLVIMDDGLQNPAIIKDFSILVIDGIYGFGNGFIFPSGPMRETLETALEKSDLVIIIGEDKFKIADSCKNKKVIFAKIKPTNAAKFKNKKVIAFCGIGRPSKFFDSLEGAGVNIIKKSEYPDHYSYSEKDLQKMISLAKKNKALLVTTKKDWVRINPKYQKQIECLDIRIEFDNKDYLKNKLKELLIKC